MVGFRFVCPVRFWMSVGFWHHWSGKERRLWNGILLLHQGKLWHAMSFSEWAERERFDES